MIQFLDKIFPILPPSVVVFLFVFFLLLNAQFFKNFPSNRTSIVYIRRGVTSFIILAGIISFVLVLPIDKALKGQVISFLGIVISAAFALSSTTLLGNLVAGVMDNSINRFRVGDLIQVESFLGRVTKKGFFHVEIQGEDSNFVTLPNLFMATHPVKITRKSKTIISTTVSLGYDISRQTIETALKKAATDAGLKDPFVYIMKLGDYSVVYKIHGFLEDSDVFFTTSSLLNAKVMDCLHDQKIEIVSPTFMNQRRTDTKVFIPKITKTRVTRKKKAEENISPEDLIFDKAIKSEEIAKKKEYLQLLEEQKKTFNDKIKQITDDDEKMLLESRVKRLDLAEEKIKENIREQEKKIEDSK